MDSLNPKWLSIELDTVSQEIEGWNHGLKESFDSLLRDFANSAHGQIEETAITTGDILD